jgi:hypothetical protein
MIGCKLEIDVAKKPVRNKSWGSRTEKSIRTLAGSALTQRPVSKRGTITVQQANTAVRAYLSKKK